MTANNYQTGLDSLTELVHIMLLSRAAQFVAVTLPTGKFRDRFLTPSPSLRLSSGPLVVRLNCENSGRLQFSLLLVILTLVSPLLVILLSGPHLKHPLGAGDSLFYPLFGEQLDADPRE